MRLLRKPHYRYWECLQAFADYLAQDNPSAAIDLWLAIDDQVSKLADPNFPRRPGRVPGTLELAAQPNVVVILEPNSKDCYAA